MFGKIKFTISALQIKSCIALSIICLILHLIVYPFLPLLHNNPLKCLISLSVVKVCANLCFFSSQYIYSYDIKYLCSVIATLRQYFILTAFMWTVINSFDVCNAFESSKSFARLKSDGNQLFVRHSLFCWTIPTVFKGMSNKLLFLSLNMQKIVLQDF